MTRHRRASAPSILLVAILASAVLLIGVARAATSPPAGDLFPDTAGHWASDLIARAVDMQIVSGYPDGSFRPNGTVTRAELTRMIVAALDLHRFSGEEAPPGPSFADVAGHWVHGGGWLAAAVERGIVVPSDYGGTFAPDQAATRLEAAVFSARAVVDSPLLAGADAFAGAGSTLHFRDGGLVPDRARGLVARASAAGIVAGYPDGSFRPDGTVTRAEAVAMVLRLVDARKRAGGVREDEEIVPVWQATRFRVRTVLPNDPVVYDVAAAGDTIYARAGERILVLDGDGVPRAEGQVDRDAVPRAPWSRPVLGPLAAAGDGTVFAGFGSGVARIADGGFQRLAGGDLQFVADGPGDEARFRDVSALAVGEDGSIHVADSGSIRRVSAGGQTETVVGPAPGQPAAFVGQAFRGDGPPERSYLPGVSGLSFGPDGTLYVAGSSYLARVVWGDWVHTFAGDREGAGGYADGGAAEGRFSRLAGLAVDPLGNAWVADRGNHRIRLVTPGGRVITVAGSGLGTVSPPRPALPAPRPIDPAWAWVLRGDHRDGPGTGAAFEDIWSLALDGRGRLWVADNGYLRVVEGLAGDGWEPDGGDLLPVPGERQRPDGVLTGTVLVQAAMGWPYEAVSLEVDGHEVGRSDDGLFSIPWDTRTVADGVHTWRMRGLARGGQWVDGPAGTVTVENNAGDGSGAPGPVTAEIVHPRSSWEGAWVRGLVPVTVLTDGTPREVRLRIDGREVARTSGRVLSFLWDAGAAGVGGHRLSLDVVDSSGRLIRDASVRETEPADALAPLPRPVRVLVNGRRVVYEGIVPVGWKDTVLLPFRQTFAWLGWWPDFDNTTRTLVAVTDATGRGSVSLSIDTGLARAGGRSFQVRRDAVPILYKNLVPLSFFAEALGAEVTWDPETSTVTMDVAPEHLGNRPTEPIPAP